MVYRRFPLRILTRYQPACPSHAATLLTAKPLANLLLLHIICHPILMVLQDGHAVSTIARKLKLTSGAIHYHINQVRAALPAIVANIEEPGFCSKSNVSEEQSWQF
jgi:hypothetical protein